MPLHLNKKPGACVTITAIILAGGRGRRMGNRDKGLLNWQDKLFIEHVIDAAAPQVDAIILSCNRNLERYRKLGYPVYNDQQQNFAGPLSGLLTCLAHVQGDHVLLLSCDTPKIPADLVSRLSAQLDSADAELAYVNDGQHQHYLCALLRCDLGPSLQSFLAQRPHASVKDWYQTLNTTEVDFRDKAQAFQNVNTEEDLAALVNGE